MIALKNIKTFILTKEDSEKIKKIMQEKNISYRELGKKLNGQVSQAMINNVVTNSYSSISKEKLIAICDALDIGIEDILESSTYSY